MLKYQWLEGKGGGMGGKVGKDRLWRGENE